MAASKSPKKQVMDVAKPGQTAADPTARPIIVKHKPMLKDPMVSAPADEAKETTEAEPTKVNVTTGRNLVIEVPKSMTDEAKKEDADATEQPAETPPEPEAEASAPEPEVTEEEKSDSSSESSDSAVVDAVAEQAELNSQQKKVDKEEAARQEMVAKLVAEKKYELPIKQQSGTGSSKNKLAVLILVLLLALSGGYVAADAGYVKLPFALPFHIMPQKPQQAATPVVPTTPVVAKPAPTSTAKDASLAMFSNKDLGVSFDYPKTWGDVTMNKADSSLKKGNSVTFGFSKQPLLAAGMLSRDYEEGGRDGSCYLSLGILPQSSLQQIKNDIKEGDSTYNTANHKVYTDILKNTADTLVFEQFEAGDIQAMGYCPGVSLVGYKSFANTSKYTGIQFYWGGDANSRKTLPANEMTKYKADPNAYLKDADRQAVLNAVTSAKTL